MSSPNRWLRFEDATIPMNMLILNIMFFQFNSLVRRYCRLNKLPHSDFRRHKLFMMDIPSLLEASSTHLQRQDPADPNLYFTDALLNRKDGSGQELTEDLVDFPDLQQLFTLQKLTTLRYPDLPESEQYRKFTVTSDGEVWDIID